MFLLFQISWSAILQHLDIVQFIKIISVNTVMFVSKMKSKRIVITK